MGWHSCCCFLKLKLACSKHTIYIYFPLGDHSSRTRGHSRVHTCTSTSGGFGVIPVELQLRTGSHSGIVDSRAASCLLLIHHDVNLDFPTLTQSTPGDSGITGCRKHKLHSASAGLLCGPVGLGIRQRQGKHDVQSDSRWIREGHKGGQGGSETSVPKAKGRETEGKGGK